MQAADDFETEGNDRRHQSGQDQTDGSVGRFAEPIVDRGEEGTPNETEHRRQDQQARSPQQSWIPGQARRHEIVDEPR